MHFTQYYLILTLNPSHCFSDKTAFKNTTNLYTLDNMQYSSQPYFIRRTTGRCCASSQLLDLLIDDLCSSRCAIKSSGNKRWHMLHKKTFLIKKLTGLFVQEHVLQYIRISQKYFLFNWPLLMIKQNTYSGNTYSGQKS